MTYIGEDDILLSVHRHIETKPVTIKDITGKSETLTGNLPTLFPSIDIGIRDIKDMEGARYPRISLQKIGPHDGKSVFGGHEKEYTFSIEAEAFSSADNRTSGISRRLQLESALNQLFRCGAYIPLYTFYYDKKEPSAAGISLHVESWSIITLDIYSIYGAASISGPWT